MVKVGARLLLALALVVANLPTTRAAAAGCGAVGVPTTTISLPNITKTLGGPGGWYTPFIVQNVGVVPTNLEVSFFRFSDGSLVTCRQVPSLAPGTSFADVPNNDLDLPDDTQFAVVVKSFGASVVSVVNEHQGAGDRAEAMSYVGLSSGTTRLYLPYVVKQLGGWLSTFVVQNLGTANANVTITLTSYDGTKTATLLRQIAAGRSAAIDPSVEPTIAAATEFAGVIASDQPVAAIVNAQNDAPGTLAPMGLSYNAVAQPQPVPVYVPAVARNADGVGRTTRLLIENAGGADATPSIVLRAASGGQITITAPAPVHPGAAWSYDPRLQADGRTACPPAGSPSCPAEGTLAAIVQGGTFAVAATSLTPTSAMGYIGQGTTGNRAYLPNVTRRLGGPNGWTTPIVIESAGATSVTLRWYRFADGVLMLRQPIPGLSAGASVTVDPRNVAALADETQYAVVVDATGGNVAAIVTELNFSGGDGDMAYEGFAATVSPSPVATAISLAPASATVVTQQALQLTAAVKDQFDNAMSAASVTWSVAPPTLGSITPTGLFTAAAASGAGTITASAGSVSASVSIVVVPPATQTIGGISFVVQSTGPADVYVESTITASDRSTINTQAAADVAQIQVDYGRTFARRPTVYVYVSTGEYIRGLQVVQGEPFQIATTLGQTTTGLFATVSTSVGVNWEKAAKDLPLTALRHELTHVMIQEIAGPYTLVPAWLNEGSAVTEELTVPGTEWKRAVNRYAAVSMSTNKALLTIADLTSQATWNARPVPLGYQQYYEAQQALQFLREDIKLSGVIVILQRMSAGQTFESAYAGVAGRPFDAFAAAFPARLQASAPATGVTTAPDSPNGPGSAPTVVLYGFAPNTTVSFQIRGQNLGYTNTTPTRAVDSVGFSYTTLTKDWPADVYTFTVTVGASTYTATFTKPALIASFSEN